MILHIFNDQKKFSKGYFQMLKDGGMDLSGHALVHYGEKDNFFEDIGLRTYYIRSFISLKNLMLSGWLRNADKIIIHSLASPVLIALLVLSSKFAKRCTWVVWGKDLYFYKSLEHPTIYHRAYEWLRKCAIPKIPKIVTIFREEFELLQQWYQINAENIELNCLYPYAIDSQEEIPVENVPPYTIWLGNSASKSNRHIDALKKLVDVASDIKTIYCPLSYGGSKKYAEYVAETGVEMFGDKFRPLMEFIPQDKYFAMMRDVDIGFFNYKRQEGLGNIFGLIFKGKTIYMNYATTTQRFFDRNTIKVLDIDSLCKFGIVVLDIGTRISNSATLKALINKEVSLAIWKRIFEMR